MRRTRARVIALAVVAGSALGSAYAGLVVTPASPSSDLIPPSSPDQLVFSIRNTGTTGFSISALMAQTMTMLVPNPAADGCAMMTLAPLGYTMGSNIPPGGEAQFTVTTTTGFAAAGAYSCTYSIVTSPSQGSASVIATFNVSSAGGSADFQPRTLDFGTVTSPGYEQQAMSLTNYSVMSPTLTLTITGDPDNVLSIAPCGTHTCMIGTPSANMTQNFFVKCAANPTTSSFVSATLQVYGGSAQQLGSDVAITCDTVGSGSGSSFGMLSVTDVMIFPPPASAGSGTASVMTTDPSTTSIASESLLGPDVTPYQLADCGGATSCTGLSLPLSTGAPRSLTVFCDLAVEAFPQPAMLEVMDNTGTMASSSVTCGTGSGSAGSAMLSAGPNPTQVGSVLVGQTGSGSFTIANTGDPFSTLGNIVVSAAPSDFSTMGVCPASAPCSLGPGNQSMTVPVTFSPSAFGAASATVSITSDAGNTSVTLEGTGLGAVMDPPSPTTVDFHTIPRGQTFTQSVTIHNSGNIPMPVMFGSASPPYTVTPPASTSVPGPGSAAWAISCGSATASASNDQTIAITSTNPPTYSGAMQSIDVKCTIADTVIQISPQIFDFKENRVGASVAPITVTITNPASAGAPANLTKFALDTQKTGLSLTPPSTSQMLAPGDVATAVLALDTSAETDLTGELLDITVDGNPLQFQVTGKVTKPHSRIAPQSLELGTACVGSQVAGTVMLINDGTATLHVFQPTTDSAFTALAQSPMSYPTDGAIVAAGTTATTQVVPSASSSGMISGELHWTDDVPSDYHVPVTLDYVANGTAVSPASLDFGAIEVGQPSGSQQITAQNCELTPKPFKVRALRGKDGAGPIGAWKIDPPVGFSTMLGANQVQVITAHFDPPGRGHYEADLELDTDVGPQTIHLTADATGRDFDHTDVYACTCSGGGVAGGWPILLALILVRRRRGSSSPR